MVVNQISVLFIYWLFFNRCAGKLNYKRQKEKEQLEKRQQKHDRRKRWESRTLLPPTPSFTYWMKIHKLNPFNCRSRSKSDDDDLDESQESEERRRKGSELSHFYGYFTSGYEKLYFWFIISFCCRKLVVLQLIFFFSFMKIYMQSINNNTSIFALDEVINPFNAVYAVSFSKK